MKTSLVTTAILLLCCLFTTRTDAQSNYSRCPDYQIDIRKGTQTTTSTYNLLNNADCSNPRNYYIGKDGVVRYRGVYQWNISSIPTNSVVNSCTLTFWVSTTPYPFQQTKYFSVSTDITSSELDLEDLWSQTNYTLTGIGYSATNQVSGNLVTTSFSGSTDSFIQAITNAISSGRFTMGAAWYYDNPSAGTVYYTFMPTNICLSINFTPPDQLVTLDQRNSFNQQVGVLKKYADSNWGSSFLPGSQFTFPLGINQTFLGDQSIISGQKYHHWTSTSDVTNHHSFLINSEISAYTSRFELIETGITIKNSLEGISLTGGTIQFRDPWLIDYPDPQFANQPRNRGMDGAEFKTLNSPFYPDASTSYDGFTYKGLFLNQQINSNIYYKLKSVSLPIGMGGSWGTRDFYFVNWGSSGAIFQNSGAAETGVVFTSGTAVVQANLKGHLLSNSTNPLGTNSQRKLVRDSDGIFHLFYISMDKMWYTKSTTTDFGGTWTGEIEIFYDTEFPPISLSVDVTNDFALPINNPAMVGDQIVLTYTDGNSLAFFILDAGVASTSNFLVRHSYTFGIPIGNNGANPVVAISKYQLTIVFKPGVSSQLYYARLYYNGGWTYDNGVIPNTDFTSLNPSIAAVKDGSFRDMIHVSYQTGNIGTSIMHTSSFFNPMLNFSTPSYVSYGTGYSVNYCPSLSLFHTGSYFYLPIVSWTARNNSEGGESRTTTEPRMVCRPAVNLNTWGNPYVAGDAVNFSNNNSVNSSGGNQTVVTWSESDGLAAHWARRDDDRFTILCTYPSGLVTNVTSGSSASTMKSFSVNSSIMPSILLPINEGLGTNYCDQPKIASPYNLLFSRSGVVLKNGIEFLFNTGDIICNNDAIKFIDIPDTLFYPTAFDLNRSLRTEDFALDQNSSLLFTNYYYVLHKPSADTLLNDNDAVNFKVELVNSQTNLVVGSFDNITYTRYNLDDFENISYEVNCEDIASGTYFLRLVVSVNGEADYVLINTNNDPSTVLKRNYNSVTYTGSEIPSEYNMSQNYPNPFNPLTVIEFQLPQAGIVSLKIYDVLGREIKTLINEEKGVGKYSVNFDASELASGTYIYRLKVNDYVSIKKMMLVK